MSVLPTSDRRFVHFKMHGNLVAPMDRTYAVFHKTKLWLVQLSGMGCLVTSVMNTFDQE